MNVADMIISAIIKKGIVYEARNAEVGFDVPIMQQNEQGDMTEKKMHISFKAEHMTLRVERDEKS
jgi:hypothetical protein